MSIIDIYKYQAPRMTWALGIAHMCSSAAVSLLCPPATALRSVGLLGNELLCLAQCWDMSSDPLPEIPSLGLSEDGRWEMMGMAYSVSVLPQAEEQSDAWACTRSTDPNEQKHMELVSRMAWRHGSLWTSCWERWGHIDCMPMISMKPEQPLFSLTSSNEISDSLALALRERDCWEDSTNSGWQLWWTSVASMSYMGSSGNWEV